MADYDAGEITDRERQAASRTRSIGNFNINSLAKQLSRQQANIDMANKQNRQLADVEVAQARRKSETERAEAQRNLLSTALSLLGEMGPTTLNSSTVGNLMSMLENRNDADNTNYWQQWQDNIDAIENANQETLNQNQVAKNENATNAAKGISDISADTSANLNNINPNLYSAPSVKRANQVYSENKVGPNMAQLSGYLMPDTSVQSARDMTPRNRLARNDYYSRLINRFNGRR